MNLYQSLGYLVLGSRMRRLSESFLGEINRAYQTAGIDFDASWFPVFYLLSKNESISIKDLSDQTEVSHPAASQLITNLKNRKLVTSVTSAEDGRKQVVKLTPAGKKLLVQIIPMWDAILLAMEEMLQSDAACRELLPAISALENAFRSAHLAEKIGDRLNIEVKTAAHE